VQQPQARHPRARADLDDVQGRRRRGDHRDLSARPALIGSAPSSTRARGPLDRLGFDGRLVDIPADRV
jgi:hypothetical protein